MIHIKFLPLDILIVVISASFHTIFVSFLENEILLWNDNTSIKGNVILPKNKNHKYSILEFDLKSWWKDDDVKGVFDKSSW